MLLELNLFRLSARLGMRCNRQGNLLILTYPRPTHRPLPFTSSPSHSPTPPHPTPIHLPPTHPIINHAQLQIKLKSEIESSLSPSQGCAQQEPNLLVRIKATAGLVSHLACTSMSQQPSSACFRPPMVTWFLVGSSRLTP